MNLLLKKGFAVKVNAVVMKGVNEAEILDFVTWSAAEPVDVRFIEFMPFEGNRWEQEKVVTWQQMLDVVRNAYGAGIEPLPRKAHETVKQYRVIGGKGTFAVISTMSAPFCGDCNRMRLTADGKMKNCLFSTSETDLLTPFRQGEDILDKILHNISIKKEGLGGQFTTAIEKIEASQLQNRSMISIGG